MQFMNRVAPLAGVLAAGVFLACDSSPDGPSATVVSMQITVGGEIVTMEGDGTVTGTLTVSSTEVLTTAFFDEAGDPITVSGTEFALALSPADTTRMQYIPTAPFEGVLEGRIAGPTTMGVSVLEVLSSTFVFGPFEVSVTVQ